jgi:hypothetical protein
MISSIGRQMGRTKGCPLNNNTGGSMSFAGTTSSYLSVANGADLRFGTGDFTIEWYQYIQGSKSFPRIFSMGSFAGTPGTTQVTIGVSIEAGANNGTFYFWTGNPRIANNFGSVGTITNTWVHFAITRSSGIVRVFKNGIQLGSNVSYSGDFNDTTNSLTIGNENALTSGGEFQGLLTNFHWVKGTALYTGKFCVPQTPRVAVADSKILLNAVTAGTVTTDTSGTGKVITNVGVTFSSSKPS